jgi:hypothetical protein
MTPAPLPVWFGLDLRLLSSALSPHTLHFLPRSIFEINKNLFETSKTGNFPLNPAV